MPPLGVCVERCGTGQGVGTCAAGKQCGAVPGIAAGTTFGTCLVPGPITENQPCGAGRACAAGLSCMPSGNAFACKRWECTGVCAAGTSCKAIKASSPSAPDGAYLVDPDGPAGANAPFQAWCLMSVDGGGWTLVARSRPGGHSPVCTAFPATTTGFGWKAATGSLTDDTQPYSLGLAATGLSFTEVLVADYVSGKAPGGNVYRLPAPANLLNGYGASAAPVSAYTQVSGSCPSGAIFLKYLGYTNRTDGFFLRDNIDPVYMGLGGDGFYTCYSDCRGAMLNGSPGMIFVR